MDGNQTSVASFLTRLFAKGENNLKQLVYHWIICCRLLSRFTSNIFFELLLYFVRERLPLMGPMEERRSWMKVRVQLKKIRGTNLVVSPFAVLWSGCRISRRDVNCKNSISPGSLQLEQRSFVLFCQSRYRVPLHETVRLSSVNDDTDNATSFIFVGFKFQEDPSSIINR